MPPRWTPTASTCGSSCAERWASSPSPSVQPALMRASRLERNPAEIAVRRAAVEAIAAHAASAGPGTLDNDATLAQTLIATAQESGRDSADKSQREELRASVAFALGVLGSDPALAQLQRMLDDPSPNVRYNAATGLARHGHAAALPVLLEMLDPGNPEAVAGEVSAAGRTWKQEAVLVNGIRAAQQWAEQNPQADRRAVSSSHPDACHCRPNGFGTNPGTPGTARAFGQAEAVISCRKRPPTEK